RRRGDRPRRPARARACGRGGAAAPGRPADRPPPGGRLARSLHARGGGRASRALRRARRPLRGERRVEGRAVPRGRRPRVRDRPAGASALPRAVPRGDGRPGPGAHPDAADGRPGGRPGRARAARPPDAAHLAVQRPRRSRAGDPVRPRRGRAAGIGPAGREAWSGLAGARGRGAARAGAQALAPPCRQSGENSMLARLLTLLALAAVAYVPAAQSSPSAVPTGLRAVLLRADEPTVTTFPRTPSFAWAPYNGALSYDFELSTSRRFAESTIVWSTGSRTTPLQVPAVTIPIALPWMTGTPYALYAHVRAHTASGVTRWSAPFGFNMRWKSVPEQLHPDIPGLVRWKPVEGATSYEVWFVDAAKVVTTNTNVADEREFYSFHPDQGWTGTIQWRVRAVRKLYGGLPNGLPVVSYGPWSDTFVSTNPPISSGPLTLVETASDAFSTTAKATAHALTPAFSFSGDTATNGLTGRLFRVYVATDKQCVNIVFKGSVVGSPAYAPRTSGPLSLPASTADVAKAATTYLADGSQAGAFSADYRSISPNEQGDSSTASGSTGSTGAPSTPTTGSTASAAQSSTSSSTPAASLPADFVATGSQVDLWDSGWPTGRYFWTVVPVREVVNNGSVQYYDAEVPQDACAAGRVAEFGKASQPVPTS